MHHSDELIELQRWIRYYTLLLSISSVLITGGLLRPNACGMTFRNRVLDRKGRGINCSI